MSSPRDKEKKKITLRITPLGRYGDTEDSTSDEDELHRGLTRNFYGTVNINEGLKEFMDWI